MEEGAKILMAVVWVSVSLSLIDGAGEQSIENDLAMSM